MNRTPPQFTTMPLFPAHSKPSLLLQWHEWKYIQEVRRPWDNSQEPEPLMKTMLVPLTEVATELVIVIRILS